jgi:hypothetical protein
MTNREIKKAFQNKFPQFVFSVTTSRGGYSESINIMIKNFEALVTDSKTYKQVASELIAFKESLKIEKIYRDHHLQEIELGGNTYVNLGYKTETGTCHFPDWV